VGRGDGRGSAQTGHRDPRDAAVCCVLTGAVDSPVQASLVAAAAPAGGSQAQQNPAVQDDGAHPPTQRLLPSAPSSSSPRLTGRLWNATSCLTAAPLPHSLTIRTHSQACGGFTQPTAARSAVHPRPPAKAKAKTASSKAFPVPSPAAGAGALENEHWKEHWRRSAGEGAFAAGAGASHPPLLASLLCGKAGDTKEGEIGLTEIHALKSTPSLRAGDAVSLVLPQPLKKKANTVAAKAAAKAAPAPSPAAGAAGAFAARAGAPSTLSRSPSHGVS
jgi:hypothetical protein